MCPSPFPPGTQVAGSGAPELPRGKGLEGPLEARLPLTLLLWPQVWGSQVYTQVECSQAQVRASRRRGPCSKESRPWQPPRWPPTPPPPKPRPPETLGPDRHFLPKHQSSGYRRQISGCLFPTRIHKLPLAPRRPEPRPRPRRHHSLQWAPKDRPSPQCGQLFPKSHKSPGAPPSASALQEALGAALSTSFPHQGPATPPNM